MIWDEILKSLKNEIPETDFNKFIKNLIFDEHNSDSKLKIFYSNNILMANWIKSNYASKIAHFFEVHLGVLPDIKILAKKHGQDKRGIIFQKEVLLKKSSTLNPSYIFENFVVGKSNKLAFNIALNAAKKQGALYNPIVICGDTGLGKTHLLNAIGNFNSNKSVICITSENFLNDFLNNINNKTMDRFRHKYRKCDYLLVDDIQFIRGKPLLQEEFFHTFNELKEHNKQIVLTSDKPITELDNIEDRLKSRFEWGLVAKIEPPELEMKIEIIKKKCELDEIFLDDEMIHYIATHVNDNIRAIEGILISINSFALIMSQEITLDFIKNAMKNYVREFKEVGTENIIECVAEHFNLKPSDIKNKKRDKEIMHARKIIIYLTKKLTRNSSLELSTYLGIKNHSTISRAVKYINEEMEKDKSFHNLIDEICSKIKNKKTKEEGNKEINKTEKSTLDAQQKHSKINGNAKEGEWLKPFSKGDYRTL